MLQQHASGPSQGQWSDGPGPNCGYVTLSKGLNLSGSQFASYKVRIKSRADGLR